MTNFLVGAILGFLACVWAIQTTPSTAFAALWDRLEEVQQTSAAASQAYDAIHLGQRHEQADDKAQARVETTNYR